MAKEVDEQRARLGRGEQLSAGWCFNPDRNPDVYKCSDEEQKVASGEISVSWDGRTVTNLKTGEVTQRDQPKEFRAQRAATFAEMTEAGQPVRNAGADNVDTGGGATGAAARGATTGGGRQTRS